MQTKRVEAGATIFKTGDPSLAVYVIADGEVAITVDEASGDERVAHLCAGELFGESGVLEGRCRSATATAVTATTLLVTEAETFFHAFGMTDERALALVKLLCRRLRETSRRAARGPSRSPPAAPPRSPIGEPSRSPAISSLRVSQSRSRRVEIEEPDAGVAGDAAIRLLPDRGRLVSQFHMSPIDVRHLPFQVGNCVGVEKPAPPSDRCCRIGARGEIDLSAPHFEIVRHEGALGIRDLRSRFGTIVNGTTIAAGSDDPFAMLHPGANDVVAGRKNSPFRFRIQVREL
jgi:CRP/FNR family transcriptional regulator, cyclic AMP receptor protein